MAAKKKTQKDLTNEQIKKARTMMSTRQPSAPANAPKVGKQTVPQTEKGKKLKYENNQKAYDALNAAGKFTTEAAIVGLGGGALIRGATKLAAKGAGKYVSNLSMESAMGQNMKGLSKATGAGGKVSRTQTPMGPTLRSTAIGTEAQQAARVNNLVTNAVKKSVNTGSVAGRKAMVDVFKAGSKAKQVGTNIAGIGIGVKNRPKKK